MRKFMPFERPNAASGGPTSEMTMLLGLRIWKDFSSVSARDGAQNGIVLPQHILKFLLLVIDHLIGSQAPHQLNVASAGRCRHLGSEVFRELDRERANASSARRDKHLV